MSHLFNNFSQIQTIHHILLGSRDVTLNKSNTVPALIKLITQWEIQGKVMQYGLEKEMATHSSDLAWRIPGTGEPGGLLRLWGRTESDTTESTAAAAMQYGLLSWLTGKESTCLRRTHRFDPWLRKIPLNRKWQPTPVFMLGKSHGQRSLAGYSPWGPKESDTTGQLSTHAQNDNVASSILDLKWSSIKPCHDLLFPVTSRFGFARLVLILVPGQDSYAFNLCC